MAPISVKFVVSFSSQDARHSVNNLLDGDGFRRWLSSPSDRTGCLEAVLQLEAPAKLAYIDVGVFWCANLELQVGRSSWPQATPYQRFLPTMAIMSAREARTAVGITKTCMLSSGDFVPETSCESWDRIKIICRQPYRKDVQFGISFIRFRTAGCDSSQTTLSQKENVGKVNPDRLPHSQPSAKPQTTCYNSFSKDDRVNNSPFSKDDRVNNSPFSKATVMSDREAVFSPVQRHIPSCVPPRNPLGRTENIRSPPSQIQTNSAGSRIHPGKTLCERTVTNISSSTAHIIHGQLPQSSKIYRPSAAASPAVTASPSVQSDHTRPSTSSSAAVELKSRLLQMAGTSEAGSASANALSRTAKMVLSSSNEKQSRYKPYAAKKPAPRKQLYSQTIQQKSEPSFEAEMKLFFEELKLTAAALEHIKVSELRHDMERRKCRKLTAEERREFLEGLQDYLCSIFSAT